MTSGGTVLTNAARDVPNVKALVYLDAFLPKQEESAATAPARLEALTPRPLVNAACNEGAGAPAWVTIPCWDLMARRTMSVERLLPDRSD